MPAPFSWTSSSPDETRRAGERIGILARPGLFIALFGTLGAGKTVLVQGIARGLGVPDWDLVSSPTFTLAARYEGRLPLLHVDAYRLRGPADLVELGFEEWIAEDGVTALEWAERAGDALPADRIEIRLDHSGDLERVLNLDAVGPQSAGVIVELADIAGSRPGPVETSS